MYINFAMILSVCYLPLFSYAVAVNVRENGGFYIEDGKGAIAFFFIMDWVMVLIPCRLQLAGHVNFSQSRCWKCWYARWFPLKPAIGRTAGFPLLLRCDGTPTPCSATAKSICMESSPCVPILKRWFPSGSRTPDALLTSIPKCVRRTSWAV